MPFIDKMQTVECDVQGNRMKIIKLPYQERQFREGVMSFG